MTMTLVQTVELSSSASSIEFTSIPQDGVDLLLVVSARTDRAEIGDGVDLLLNGSSANFSGRVLFGQGASVSSFSVTQSTFYTSSATATGSTFGNGQVLISNYSGSTNKSISTDGVSENNATNAFQTIGALQWANTSAITSLAIEPNLGSNFIAGSTASLYKIS